MEELVLAQDDAGGQAAALAEMPTMGAGAAAATVQYARGLQADDRWKEALARDRERWKKNWAASIKLGYRKEPATRHRLLFGEPMEACKELREWYDASPLSHKMKKQKVGRYLKDGLNWRG